MAKIKKAKKIRVISWNSEDRCEPDIWYELDSKKDRERFLQDIRTNSEADGRDSITVLSITKKQWAKAVRVGKDLA